MTIVVNRSIRYSFLSLNNKYEKILIVLLCLALTFTTQMVSASGRNKTNPIEIQTIKTDSQNQNTENNKLEAKNQKSQRQESKILDELSQEEKQRIEIHRKAWEIYNNVQQKINKDNTKPNNHYLLKLEKELIEAIKLVPEDNPALYVPEETIGFNGRWPSYIIVVVPKEYFPNNLIYTIRKKLPPIPFAQASIKYKDDYILISLNIRNTGKTRMEQNAIILEGMAGNLEDESIKTIDFIFPGKQKTVQWKLSTQKNVSRIKLQFKEKFGFTLFPLTLSL